MNTVNIEKKIQFPLFKLCSWKVDTAGYTIYIAKLEEIRIKKGEADFRQMAF